MKWIIQLIIHFIASIFLYLVIGMGLSFLILQSKFIDMRFDIEYFITISILVGLWSYFSRRFMNAKTFSLWEKKWISMILVVLSLAIVLIHSLSNESLTILPAYMVRKALFLDGVVQLSGMNIILLIGLLIGLLSLVAANRLPIALKKETKMDWERLPKSSRVGMVTLFGIPSLFLLLYLGQGAINVINDSISYLKNADVEGFRDYLLSFGPLAAVMSGILMVFQSIIAPLPAFVITFANGTLFGWFFGAILSWSSAMLGAVLCFYIAKFLGRPVVEKFVTKKALDWWDQFFSKYGKHSVFIARLLPIVSFDLVSYAAGTTSISFWQFFWATGLGQLPATILYSYLGQNATDTVEILFFLFTIIIALTVIGMLLRPEN